MDTLPIYYDSSTPSSVRATARARPESSMSFPVSVRSLAADDSPPVPPRPGVGMEQARSSRASKRGSVMFNSSSTLTSPPSGPFPSMPCPPIEEAPVARRTTPPALPPRPVPVPPTPAPRIPTSSSSSSLHFGTQALSALNRGFKDRFAAGVGGLTKEWTSKGKGRFRDEPPPALAGTTSAAIQPTRSPRLDGAALSLSSPGSTSPSIRLPAVIFDVQVPRVTGVAFGTPLAALVKTTHLASSVPPRPVSSSPITGDACLLYLPAIAYRCLEYLSSTLGLDEEGIYRIPGRSQMVSQLRTLFDSGIRGQDLRELHQSRLDPNAVASCFKNWLRELPESLLSNELAADIDRLTLNRLGYTASSVHFLSSTAASASASIPKPTSPNPAEPSVPTTSSERVAPLEYLEELSQLLADEMKAENFYLLRAISYHLALMASHSTKNKMTLTNLRLILSPTLRLTPEFLLVLVEEREIVFGGINRDAKRRQGATSNLVTPPLLSVASFPRDSHPPLPAPSSPLAPPPARVTTPIADKFSSSAIPLAPPLLPPPPPPSRPIQPRKDPPPPLPRRKERAVDDDAIVATSSQGGFFSSGSSGSSRSLTSPHCAAAADTGHEDEQDGEDDDDDVLGLMLRRGGGNETETTAGTRRERDPDANANETTTKTKTRIKSEDLTLRLANGFDDAIGLTGLGFRAVE